MKVEGPQGSKIGQVRRKSATSSSDGDFASALESESSAPTPVGLGAPPSIAMVGSLLALQQAGAEEGDAAKERAKNRAAELLRELELLRLDILTGVIPRGHLTALAATIKTSREGVFDPRLNEILDEIDLRAQVELAKYERDR